MGFGLLFLGYFAVYLMTLNPIGALLRVLGYGIIFASSLKLRKYHRSFVWLTIGTGIMILSSVTLLTADVTNYLYENLVLHTKPFSDSLKLTIGYLEQGLSFAFHTALLWAIYKIAKETEIKKISDSAIRNFIFICFYYLVYAVRYLPFESVRNCAPELTMIGWILYLTCILLNLIVIFKCYANICDESDVEMIRKPSRVAWINHMRAEFDRREQKAREETAAYRQEKLEKRKRRKK